MILPYTSKISSRWAEVTFFVSRRTTIEVERRGEGDLPPTSVSSVPPRASRWRERADLDRDLERESSVSETQPNSGEGVAYMDRSEGALPRGLLIVRDGRGTTRNRTPPGGETIRP